MSKQKSFTVRDYNLDTVERFTAEHGATTKYFNKLIEISSHFDDIDEMQEVIEEMSDNEGRTDIVPTDEQGVNPGSLELGHGIPVSLDDALDMSIKTEASERVAIIEAVLVDEGPQISERKVDYIIDTLFNQPADQTVEKYKTLLLTKTGVNALPGSDVRLMEPTEDYKVEGVNYDSTKHNLNNIPNDDACAYARDMHVSKFLTVWTDLPTGFVTDRDSWIVEVVEVVSMTLQDIATYTQTDRQFQKHADGKVHALKLFVERLDELLIEEGYETNLMSRAAAVENGYSVSDQMDIVRESLRGGDVDDDEVEQAMDVLGVDTTSTDEVVEAFNVKVKQCHPDLGGDDEQFKAVQEAKEILVMCD